MAQTLCFLLFVFSLALQGQEREIFKTTVITSQGVVTKEYYGEIIIKPRVTPGATLPSMLAGISVSIASEKSLKVARTAISSDMCDSLGYCYVPFVGGDLHAMSSAASQLSRDVHFEMASLSPVLKARQAPSVSPTQYPYAQAQWYLGNVPGGINWSPYSPVGNPIYYVTMDSGILYAHQSYDPSKLEQSLIWNGVKNVYAYPPDNGGDDNGHGTNGSLIVLSVKNVVGLANWVKYGNFKVLNYKGQGDTKTIVEGFLELVNRIKLLPANSRVLVSMAFGSLEKIQPIEDAIQIAIKAGIVVTAAAGNDGVDADRFEQTPTTTPGVISVGACGMDNAMVLTKAWASTYGKKSVATCAPGVRILTGMPAPTEGVPYDRLAVDSRMYGFVEGTSFAVKIVDAMILTMLDMDPTLTIEQIRMRVMYGDRDLQSVTIWERILFGDGLFRSGGRMNWAKGTAPRPASAPPQPTISLKAGHSSLRVKFDGEFGPGQNALRCRLGNLGDEKIWEAIPYFGEEVIITGPDGTPLTLSDATQQMVCQTADFAGQWSKLSAPVSFRMLPSKATPVPLNTLSVVPGPLTQLIQQIDGYLVQPIWYLSLVPSMGPNPVLIAGRRGALDYKVGDNDSVAEWIAELPEGNSVSLHMDKFVWMEGRESWHFDKLQVTVISDVNGGKKEDFLTDLIPSNRDILGFGPEHYALDLSKYAGQRVILRFRFFTNQSSQGLPPMITNLEIRSDSTASALDSVASARFSADPMLESGSPVKVIYNRKYRVTGSGFLGRNMAVLMNDLRQETKVLSDTELEVSFDQRISTFFGRPDNVVKVADIPVSANDPGVAVHIASGFSVRLEVAAGF